MNKILVNNEKRKLTLEDDRYCFSEDGKYALEFENGTYEVFLVVSEYRQVVLDLFGKNVNLSIHVKVEKNASFTFNQLIIDGSMKIESRLVGEHASFTFHNSILSKNNSFNTVQVYHEASFSESYLKNHGFSKDGARISFDVSAYIGKEITKCVSKQDNQIIEEENGYSQINPNLYIENYDVEASHSAYVGEFKEEELFYLMSRGIDLETSKFLLLKAFLTTGFSLEDDVEEKYYHEIIKYFNREV